MSWFKVDDGFGSHPKVMMIPRAERAACIGAWLMAGVWSAQHLTDGRVPGYMLDELGIEVSQRVSLGTVGLWVEDGDGIAFKDWSDHQPTRADVLAAREKERARKEEYRRKKAGNTRQSPAGTPADEDAGRQRVSGHPDPTRPDPTPIEVEANAPTSLSDRERSNDDGELLPESWRPTKKHYDHAVSLGLDPQRELDAFRKHAVRVQRRQRNWNTAFTNWLKKGAEMAQQRAVSGGNTHARPSKATEALDFVARLEAEDAARRSGPATDGHLELR